MRRRPIRKHRAFDKRPSQPIEIPLPAGVRGSFLEPDAKRYRMGHCSIIVGTIPGLGWHLSITHPTRYPSWDEIADARYTLLPDDVTMAMILPPKAQYVNLHPNSFHLHQIERVKRPTRRILKPLARRRS